MLDELSNAIDQDFAPSVCAYLIDSLTASSIDAARRFNDGIGCNANTFGMDSYHFAVFQFRDGLSFDPDGVQLAQTATELEFRLQIGRFRTAIH